MSAYEDAPRHAADLWGSRKTTALGVRVARNLSRSLVPGSGFAAVTTRTLASVPIMIATAALLARGAFLVACSLLLNVVLVPRLARGSLFQWVVLGLATVGSLLFWAVLVRRRAGRGRWRGWVALGVTLAVRPRVDRHALAVAPGAIGTGAGGGHVAVGLVGGARQAPVRCHRRGPGHRPRLVRWAQKAWAVTEAAIIGAVWGWWVIVGAWKPAGRLACRPRCRPPWARCGSRRWRSSSSRRG